MSRGDRARRIAYRSVVALASVVMIGCGGDDGPKPPAGMKGIGAGVVVDRTFAQDLDAKAAQLPRSPAPGLEAMSKTFEIDADEQPGKPVRVALPLNRALAGDDFLVAMVADAPEGPWTPVRAKVLPGGSYAAFDAPHFSYFGVFRADVSEILGAVRDLFDGATAYAAAEAEQPRCSDEDGARTEGFSVSSRGPGTLKWCFGRQRDGRRILRVSNARRYYLMLEHPGAKTIEKPSSPLLDPARLAQRVDSKRTALPPRGQVTYSLSGSARIRSEFDGLAQSLYALDMGVELAVSFVTKFGGNKAGAREKLASTLYGSQKCARQLGQLEDGGALIAKCFDIGTLTEAFGAKGAVAGAFMAVGAVVEFLRSELNALGDQLNGRDRYSIRVKRVQPPVLGRTDMVTNGDGWGEVAPGEIYNGGVPSGLVQDITWTDWGSATARGRGKKAVYKPEGGYYAEPVEVELEATGLGTCPGEDDSAYTRLRVRAPDAPGEPLGDWFLWTLTTCEWGADAEECGQAGGTPNTDDVTTDVTAWDTSCATALKLARALSNVDLEASAEPDDYREESDGFVCNGYAFDDALPYLSWTCLRGTAQVTFKDY